MKDLKSLPRKNYYFPIRFGEAVRLIKELELRQNNGDRLAIRMKNVQATFDYGYLLADIMPNEDITIYSLPIELESKIITSVAVKALTELSKVQTRSQVGDSRNYSYFCAYLKDLSEIVITKINVSLKKKKYSADSRFSNAFKPKAVDRNEMVLCAINI